VKVWASKEKTEVQRGKIRGRRRRKEHKINVYNCALLFSCRLHTYIGQKNIIPQKKKKRPFEDLNLEG
jgi:hypothetical protein